MSVAGAPDGSTHDVEDTFAYLLGRWRLSRTIRDERTRASGTFSGIAVVEYRDRDREAGGTPRARYHEQGELQFALHRGPAERSLEIVRFEDGSVGLLFVDGRPFVNLDLSSGRCEVSHRCGDDRYGLLAIARDGDRWEEHWEVDGPRKRYRASTVLERVGAGDRDGPPPA